ncbi:MAG: DUF86 domain-containing protein [Jiangellaceae bacterium]
MTADSVLIDHPDRLDAVKYRFVTVIEGCVSVAHHIVVAEGWGVPETNADALRELGRHGVVNPALAGSVPGPLQRGGSAP